MPPTIPHYNGTLIWHPAMTPRPLPQSWLSPSPLAPCNGTTSCAPCNGTLVPRPIRQSGSSPSPPIGSKDPYSFRSLGKNNTSICIENRLWPTCHHRKTSRKSHILYTRTFGACSTSCIKTSSSPAQRMQPLVQLTWNCFQAHKIHSS